MEDEVLQIDFDVALIVSDVQKPWKYKMPHLTDLFLSCYEKSPYADFDFLILRRSIKEGNMISHMIKYRGRRKSRYTGQGISEKVL